MQRTLDPRTDPLDEAMAAFADVIPGFEIEEEETSPWQQVVLRESEDFFRPSVAGLLSGGAAGVFGLFLAELSAVVTGAAATPIDHVARVIPGALVSAATLVSMAAAVAIGGLVGAAFARVTRYLRRYVPLLVWSVFFFGSVTVVLLALIAMRRPGGVVETVGVLPIVVASIGYAIVASFALPLRRGA
jgi:hypothetical protein